MDGGGRDSKTLQVPGETLRHSLQSRRMLIGQTLDTRGYFGQPFTILALSEGFDSADSLAETIDSRRVEVNFNLRPSPVKEYNTPVVTNIQRNSRERRKKVSLTEKKKSPAVAKSPDLKSSNIPSSKREEIEKEGAYEWLNFVRRKKPLVDHNKAISNPHSSKPHQAVDEPPEVVEHRKKYSHGAAKSKMPDPTYCPIQVSNSQ
ncbi:hypothetical protein OSTOST_08907 [Ostertagia ostertagi]